MEGRQQRRPVVSEAHSAPREPRASIDVRTTTERTERAHLPTRQRNYAVASGTNEAPHPHENQSTHTWIYTPETTKKPAADGKLANDDGSWSEQYLCVVHVTQCWREILAYPVDLPANAGKHR